MFTEFDRSSAVREGPVEPAAVAEEIHVRLTAREREVLTLIADGYSTREIAESLNVSPKTVETHRKHVMDKLEIRSIARLTKYAIRVGLTTLAVR